MMFMKGKIAGFSTSVNGQYTNYDLGIIVSNKDKFGNEQVQTQIISVSQNDAPHIENFVNANKGKLAEVPLYVQALNGNKGAWLKVSLASAQMPKVI